MQTPHTTSTGVKIGSRYTKPLLRESDPDMLAWQRAFSPPLEKEFKHWGKKVVACILISGLLFTYWNLYV
jgi:hypothetical protein